MKSYNPIAGLETRNTGSDGRDNARSFMSIDTRRGQEPILDFL